ncbi:Mobile element protein [Richelia intracellularis]|nr:Mobile element protein [Richelia intracellularis]
MYIKCIPSRNSPPAVLLRESYSEDGKVRKRTLANVSKLPSETVDDFKILLKGGKAVEDLEEIFKIIRSRPHGHVAGTLSSLIKLGLHTLIDSSNSRIRRIIEAMIVACIVKPAYKLATARGLDGETFFSSLGEVLELEEGDEDELYLAMDLFLERQGETG